MTDDTCRRITAERLAGWAAKLAAEHATPALLLGVGHDRNSGALVVCCTEDMTDEQLRAFAAGLLRALP